MFPGLKQKAGFEGVSKTKIQELPREFFRIDSNSCRSANESRSSHKVNSYVMLSRGAAVDLKGSIKNAVYTGKRSTGVEAKKSVDFSDQIRTIEKKIRMCQKKIQAEKRSKALRDYDQDIYETNFQKILNQEVQAQKTNEQKGFDYLTNPGKRQEVEEVEPAQEMSLEHNKIPTKKQFNIEQNVCKLQKTYENSLRRKFERREMFPHQPCRRKVPKLYISHKSNGIQKQGMASHKEHMYRIITKEVTPQQIYPVIPNFPLVKDCLSKNVLAYLGNYRPFLEKTKEFENSNQAVNINEDGTTYCDDKKLSEDLQNEINEAND